MKKTKFIILFILSSVLCLALGALADTYKDKTAADDDLEPTKQIIERSYIKTEDFTIDDRLDEYNFAKEEAQYYINEANIYADELTEIKVQTGKDFVVPAKLRIIEIK